MNRERVGVENAVEARGVGKVFSSRSGEVTALDGIDLTVADGEFVSLIGPSGCGKSTLLRIVGDLIQPSSGEVVVNGKTADQARRDGGRRRARRARVVHLTSA